MRGHEELIEMRLNGKAPSIIFINDYPCQTDWENYGDYVTICTAEDPIKTLDMRFLVDMTVLVSSTSEKRAMELLEACKEHGVRKVVSTHLIEGKNDWEQDGWMEIWQK